MEMQFTIHWLQGTSGLLWEMLLKPTVQWDVFVLYFACFPLSSSVYRAVTSHGSSCLEQTTLKLEYYGSKTRQAPADSLAPLNLLLFCTLPLC